MIIVKTNLNEDGYEVYLEASRNTRMVFAGDYVIYAFTSEEEFRDKFKDAPKFGDRDWIEWERDEEENEERK